MNNLEKIKKKQEEIEKSNEKIKKEKEKIVKLNREIKELETLEIKALLTEIDMPLSEVKSFLKNNLKRGN